VETFRLVWGIIWRMVIWGVGGGAVLGGLYATVLFLASSASYLLPTGLLFGAVVGGIFGLALGLVDGPVLAAITYFAFRDPLNVRRYRITMGVISVAIFGLGTLLGCVAFWGSLLSQPSDLAPWLWAAVVPTLIAVGAAWWVSGRLARWVVQERTLT
jgi:hypothetical protein